MSTTVIDENLTVDTSSSVWSETRWNGCWSPESGAGLFIHAGRFRKDRDFWWVHFAAYLPGDRLAVTRFWTRNPTSAGIRSELLDVEITADGWNSRFDGAADITSNEALAHEADRRTGPSARVLWAVSATPRTPVWDIYADGARTQTFASASHVQQAYDTTGSLTVDDETYTLDGVGFKDHSSGVRSHVGWIGDSFMIAVMPDHTIHAITVMTQEHPEGRSFGTIFAGDRQRPVEQFRTPPMLSADGGPFDNEVVVTGPDGRPVTLRVEILNTLVQTVYTSEQHYDSFNGVDWSVPGDPMLFAESAARVTDPDGVVGYAHFERSVRRSALARP